QLSDSPGGASGAPVAAITLSGNPHSAVAVATPSPFLHALSFTSGFSLVFILFGISLGLVGFFLRDQQDIILKLAGGLLIVLGLHLSRVITIPFLEQERRLDVDAGTKVGYARSFVVGSAFSAGWSPCIGPTLGAILALAVSSGTVLQAGILLLAYSAGLAIPFLAMGLAFNSVKPIYNRVKPYMGVVNYVSGALLIVIGIIIFTNSLINFNSLFNFGFLGDIAAET
ncbi:MAG: cytochrome c biogenesis CcdA family protein, partial [Dehalococcoidia bacterium]